MQNSEENHGVVDWHLGVHSFIGKWGGMGLMGLLFRVSMNPLGLMDSFCVILISKWHHDKCSAMENNLLVRNSILWESLVIPIQLIDFFFKAPWKKRSFNISLFKQFLQHQYDKMVDEKDAELKCWKEKQRNINLCKKPLVRVWKKSIQWLLMHHQLTRGQTLFWKVA